jgi:hypothetical protein
MHRHKPAFTIDFCSDFYASQITDRAPATAKILSPQASYEATPISRVSVCIAAPGHFLRQEKEIELYENMFISCVTRHQKDAMPYAAFSAPASRRCFLSHFFGHGTLAQVA